MENEIFGKSILDAIDEVRKLQQPGINKAKEYLETRKDWLRMSTNNEEERILIRSLMEVWEDMSEYLMIIWETSRKSKEQWITFWIK